MKTRDESSMNGIVRSCAFRTNFRFGLNRIDASQWFVDRGTALRFPLSMSECVRQMR